jgi:hypothetical protein
VVRACAHLRNTGSDAADGGNGALAEFVVALADVLAELLDDLLRIGLRCDVREDVHLEHLHRRRVVVPACRVSLSL